MKKARAAATMNISRWDIECEIDIMFVGDGRIDIIFVGDGRIDIIFVGDGRIDIIFVGENACIIDIILVGV